jgi:hypothetical protein
VAQALSMCTAEDAFLVLPYGNTDTSGQLVAILAVQGPAGRFDEHAMAAAVELLTRRACSRPLCTDPPLPLRQREGAHT